MSINILSGGKMGDFIHQLFAVKNICNERGNMANLFIGGGDPFKDGLQKAYSDLYELVIQQPYINSFCIYKHESIRYDLNHWRVDTLKTRHDTGKYNKCWSDLLMDTYGFKFSGYQWGFIRCFDIKPRQNIIMVHRSKSRHNDHCTMWNDLFKDNPKNVLFITSDISEYNSFEFKDKCELLLLPSIYEMAIAIDSCKLFIGNQSMPFALACALDVPRICELDYDAAPFYMGEEKYSKNISWMLNSETKYEAAV